MLIEVKEIHPSPGERKPASVIAMDGKKYDIWPENLSGVLVGRRYEVETKPRQWNNRTFYTITKATPVNDDASFSSPSNGGGSSGEAEFSGHVVAALILKGEITKKEIPSYTARLRQIWRETDPDAQPYSQAAE